MKKISLVLVFVFLIFPVSGCGKGVAQAPASSETPVATDKPSASENEFYERVNLDDRPIAIMIDNDNKDAWPHSGLEDAYMIYEMYVEGGATRLMALYKGVDAEKIGPVRSSRHYFIDYVLENNAVYVHFGQSPKAGSDLVSLGIDHINGVSGGDGNMFWRQYKKKNDWHSAYTSIAKIKDMISQKGFKTSGGKLSLKFSKEFSDIKNGEEAKTIELNYSPSYKVKYEYSDADKVYYRFMNSKSHEDSNGVKFTATNVIVQHVKNYNLGDGSARQEIDTVGSGTGYYYTMGKVVPIKWSKKSRAERTVFQYQNGEELIVNPGRTFIQLIPNN